MNTNEKFKWANDYSRLFLSRGYLKEGQEVEHRVKDIALHAEKLLGIDGFAEKFYYFMSRGFYSLSSPVWSNFGEKSGLPVSCFGSYIDDGMGSILYTNAEVGAMSKFGGGCSGYFGNLRSRGSSIGDNQGKSSGAVHFMELFETLTNVVSQGSVRRGFFSPYLPIEHNDSYKFMDIGKEGNPIQQLTYGVTVSDKFLEDAKKGNSENQKKWGKLIQTRGELGYPYVLFIDNVNRNTVDVYKDKGMKIVASNMCSEIALPSSSDESFVCVLSSMNLRKYDEWKDTDAVEVLTYFLDAVVTEFLNKIDAMKDSDDPDHRYLHLFMSRAYKFAKNHRALGIGTLGWHHLLQSKMIPFESDEAKLLNIEAHKLISEKSWKASKELAEIFGEPEVLKGYGRRNTTLTAIAPTKSSSFILEQTSQSIEPEESNYYIKDLAKVKETIRNPFLAKLLEEKYDINEDHEIWVKIRKNDGSVQNLDFLTQHEKDVFKTFGEISQFTIIEQAADRQEFVDQSQSLNLRVKGSTKPVEIHKLYLYAYQLGICSLYYQKSTNAAQDLARDRANCAACEA